MNISKLPAVSPSPNEIFGSADCYFAGTNSSSGFINYFDNILTPEGRSAYIVKGGPGSGKSTFMCSAAEYAEKCGYDVTYCPCSSDPESLDGIVIDKLNLSIADGTAPHVCEPRIPCVCDSIIDLGQFCSKDIIMQSKDEISDLNIKKSQCFSNAYSCLASASYAERVCRDLTYPCIYSDKILSAAGRISKNFIGSRCGQEKNHAEFPVRLIRAYSGSGDIILDSFALNSDIVFDITDRFGIGYIILRSLLDECRIRNTDAFVSYSPLDTHYENALYLPESRAAFMINYRMMRGDLICSQDTGVKCEFRNINAGRFINLNQFRQARHKVRQMSGLRDAAVLRALEFLADAKALHGRLEAFYAHATDYDRKEKYCSKLIHEIFDN